MSEATMTPDKLQIIIAEETIKFVKESQEEIVRRAWKRLQEEKAKRDAELP